jgi:hypothetical protein
MGISPEYYPEDNTVVNNRRVSDYGAVSGGYQPPSHRDVTGYGMENEYGLQQDYNHLQQHGRSMSMQHSTDSANYQDMQHHRRGSTGYYGGPPPRRDMDYDDGRERIGTMNYPRQDRLVTPAHSPMTMQYGNHSRASSDMGSTVSSSPMSFMSGVSFNDSIFRMSTD